MHPKIDELVRFTYRPDSSMYHICPSLLKKRKGWWFRTTALAPQLVSLFLQAAEGLKKKTDASTPDDMPEVTPALAAEAKAKVQEAVKEVEEESEAAVRPRRTRREN
jgi:hypothetical protein